MEDIIIGEAVSLPSQKQASLRSHECMLPGLEDIKSNVEAELINGQTVWTCVCRKRYRLNEIVRRWYYLTSAVERESWRSE